MIMQSEYIMNLASKGMRIDNRKPEDFREIKLEKGVTGNAEGSARIRMGKTEIMVGIKMGVGVPFPDSQDKGVLIVGAEFSPIASPDFEKGPPRENAIELARIVDRGIRESKAIDLEKLCIKEKEKVWMVFIDIHILNHDGNLIDAAGLAAIQALLDAKMPEYLEKEDKVSYEKRTKPLLVKSKPIPVTVAKMGGNLFIDPSLEEENAMDTRLIVGTKDNGNICALQKGGVEALKIEEIDRIFELATRKAEELRKLLK